MFLKRERLERTVSVPFVLPAGEVLSCGNMKKATGKMWAILH